MIRLWWVGREVKTGCYERIEMRSARPGRQPDPRGGEGRNRIWSSYHAWVTDGSGQQVNSTDRSRLELEYDRLMPFLSQPLRTDLGFHPRWVGAHSSDIQHAIVPFRGRH